MHMTNNPEFFDKLRKEIDKEETVNPEKEASKCCEEDLDERIERIVDKRIEKVFKPEGSTTVKVPKIIVTKEAKEVLDAFEELLDRVREWKQ